MPRFAKSLFGQVVIALVLGVLAGLLVPEFAIKLKPLGDGFIKLLKMIIPVLVFCVVVHGIAGAGDLKRVGRVGVKALIYFEILTTIALVMGLAAAFYFQPGAGMNVDPKALDASAMSAYASNADKLTSGGTVDFLMRLIPTTVINAFATGDVLQVLLFAVLFGCALTMLGERGKPVATMIDVTSLVLFKIMGIIIPLAAVFIAQATNTPNSMADLLTIPAIGLVLSVDWFMGIARALGNLIGNCVATVAIAAWEGDIDRERAHAVLDGRDVPEDATSATLPEPTTAHAAH